MNKSWEELNQEINESNVLSPDAVLIADEEPELKNPSNRPKKISTRLYTFPP